MRVPAGCHIKQASEFNRIFKKGKRISTKYFVVLVTSSECLRYGFAVSRSVGKAAKRNFARRRLKEILWRNTSNLPSNKSLVFIARPPILRARFSALESDFQLLLRKL